MSGYVIIKWVEPYVLLETAKKSFEMKDFTFDGFNKNDVKKEFLKALEKSQSFGLYMKNVNKFYLFQSHYTIDIKEFLTAKMGLNTEDFYAVDNFDEPINLVDLGKAEAAFLSA